MDYEHILYEVSEGIATITMNRPDRLNAWTGTMDQNIRHALREATDDSDVKVIILTGAGRGFCAGADLGGLEATAKSDKKPEPGAASKAPPAFDEESRDDFHRTYTYFPSVPKPIIAAVNGPCAGLGMVMALFCDMRIAGEKAAFTTAFAKRGLIAEHGMSWVLPRLTGHSNALDLLMSARKVTAGEALQMGLVNQVLPQDSLMSGVREYAKDIAANVSPRSTRVMKQQVYNALMENLGEATDIANVEMVKSLQCDDFKEGVAHFLEKRPAAFTGN